MKPKTIAFGILAVFAFLVTALWARAGEQTITFAWDSSEPRSEIAGYTLRAVPKTGGGVGYVKNLSGQGTTGSMSLPRGTVWLVTVEGVSTNGMTSDPSLPLELRFPSQPGAPAILSVSQVTTTTTVTQWVVLP